MITRINMENIKDLDLDSCRLNLDIASASSVRILDTLIFFDFNTLLGILKWKKIFENIFSLN